MKDFLKSFGTALAVSIVAILTFFVASGVYQRFSGSYTGFFGIGYAEVVSGSMTPNILEGDMIIYQARPNLDYAVGDVVVYIRDEGTINEKLITHRMKSIEDGIVITRGDANSRDDDPFPEENLIGRVVFRIPAIGKFGEFLKTPEGYLAFAVVAIVVIVIGLVIVRVANRKNPIMTVSGKEHIEY